MMLLKVANQHPYQQIRLYVECQRNMSKNAYEKMLADNADAYASYPSADPDAT